MNPKTFKSVAQAKQSKCKAIAWDAEDPSLIYGLDSLDDACQFCALHENGDWCYQGRPFSEV